jgi:hypothetical protein
VVAAGASPPLKVDLAPPQDLALSASRKKGRTILNVKAQSTQAGAVIVLQAYLRERFGWWTIKHAKLSPSRHASFRLGRTRVGRLRALVFGPDGFTVAATSNELRLKRSHHHRG